MRCPLCGRDQPLTKHHLIPRTVHKNKWFKKRFTREEMGTGVDVCRDCHSAIHKYIPSEKELGRSFNTLELLQEHEELSRYVKWLSRQRRAGRHKVRR